MSDPPRAFAATLVVIALLLGPVAAPTTVQSVDLVGESPFAATAAQVEPDAVLLSVDVQPDGSAAWRIEYRVRLDDENTTAAFESLAADVEANGSAYVARFEDRMTPTVQDAAAMTGREMALRDVRVSTTTSQLPQTYGVLVYTFEWTGFAAVDGDRLRVGDALAGLFLDADSTLLMAWPDGYAVVEVSPPPTEQREDSVVWRGPLDFGPGEPDLVLDAEPSPAGPDRSLLGLGVVLLVLVGGGIAWWWRRGRSPAAPAGGAATEPEAAAPPDELLSNEERVIALLERHGGRMKQQDIVEELGWTEAKTSQVVGRLRDAGRIEGFRLGRENVLRLPTGDDPLDEAPGRTAADDQREA